jgi:hypothetical protein
VQVTLEGDAAPVLIFQPPLALIQLRDHLGPQVGDVLNRNL